MQKEGRLEQQEARAREKQEQPPTGTRQNKERSKHSEVEEGKG